MLDVGCGDGLFFPRLREFGSVQGIETDVSLLSAENPDRSAISSKPLGDPSYAQARFDLITACDVIEHIEDDHSAVSQMASMLNPGGFLVLTVPAFMSLWDEHDEINLHFRRYDTGMLRGAIPGSLTILQMRYLFHTLFVPKYLVRLVNKTRVSKVSQAQIPPKPLNDVMTKLCEWENRAIGTARLPFGTSLLAVTQKQS